MAGSNYKPAVSGDRVQFNPEWLNGVTKTAEDRRRKLLSQPASGQAAQIPAGVILIANNSGDDVDRYAVLGIDDILWGPDDNLDEFKNNAALMCVTPAEPDHRGRFVITCEPIKKNEVGRAYLFGRTRVQVNINDESDQYADILAGDNTQLDSGPTGQVEILWAESGTGTKWADVRFGGTSTAKFVISGARPMPGAYTAHALLRPTGTIDTSASTPFTAADLGAAATSTVYAVNAYEEGKDPAEPSQNDLRVGQVFTGSFLTHDDDGTPVYLVEGIFYKNC